MFLNDVILCWIHSNPSTQLKSFFGNPLHNPFLDEIFLKIYLKQGIVDSYVSKPALRQDTGYMVEKTYHDIAPYLGAFGAFLMSGSKGVFIYQNDRWNVAINSHYLSFGQKNISFGQKRPQQTI